MPMPGEGGSCRRTMGWEGRGARRGPGWSKRGGGGWGDRERPGHARGEEEGWLRGSAGAGGGPGGPEASPRASRAVLVTMRRGLPVAALVMGFWGSTSVSTPQGSCDVPRTFVGVLKGGGPV